MLSRKVLFFLLATVGVQAQVCTTLQECYQAATATYPVSRQDALLQSSNRLALRNLNATYFPQLELSGQATWQTEVTELQLPAGLPFEAPTLSPDQYKLTLDIRQFLWDGGLTSRMKSVQEASYLSEKQKLQVELYKLRDRVNQWYFGILQLDEQARIAGLLISDLDARIKKTQAAIANGVAIPMNLQMLEAEKLKGQQRLTEIYASRQAAVRMLSLLTGKDFPENTVFEKPALPASATTAIQRPELAAFQAQQTLLDQQQQAVVARSMPKISAFVTGGYGRPGLNFLLDEFRFFAITGLGLKWNFTDLLSGKAVNERQLLQLQKETATLQQDVFVLNTNLQLQQLQAEIQKLETLLSSDRQLLDLRTKIKNTVANQLDNGITTINDYLLEVHAEDLARQNLALHELQLLMNQALVATLLGNQ